MFVFRSESLFTQAKKRIARILEERYKVPASFNYKDATVFVLGHDDLGTYKSACRQPADEAACRRDEELSIDELDKRRFHQAARLQEFAARHNLEVDAMAVVEAWRPTAARPQEDTRALIEAPRARERGVQGRLLILLIELDLSGRDPAPAELTFILNSIPACDDNELFVVEAYAGPVAVRLCNRRGAAAQSGIEILEVMFARRAGLSGLSLARALVNGWGRKREPDLRRARSILKCVEQMVSARDLRLLTAEGHIELYATLAHLVFTGAGGERDPLQACELFERAAHWGHGPSALEAFRFYFPGDPPEGPDQYSGVKEPNESLARYYFALAVHLGYDPKAKVFRTHGPATEGAHV